MKNLIREYIKKTVRSHLMEQLYEEKAYPLSLLSAACSMALDKLKIPDSAITDVKIIKATRPIFKVFLENGESFNLIDNNSFVQADIDRILYDVDDERDLNAAKSEIDRIINLGHMKDDNEGEADGEFEEPVEEPTEEPAPEEEV